MNYIQQVIKMTQAGCANTFLQKRTQQRAAELIMGSVSSVGRRTLSRAICALGHQNQDWSADYKLFSRSEWNPDNMFLPVIQDYHDRFKNGPIRLAFDDTKLPKSGRHIKTAFWQKDPMSPPFHVNLQFGLRFMQVSLLYPLHEFGDADARGIPVRFTECPALKKPGKRATTEQVQEWKKAKKLNNLSTQTLEVIKGLRSDCDHIGAKDRNLFLAADGSLCNRTIMKTPIERVDIVARCRKDAKLCHPAQPGGRRKYDTAVFTPEDVRKQDTPWLDAQIYYGGDRRTIHYKEIKNVLWRKGGGLRPLRLIVIRPLPYKVSPNARYNYRAPAFLLCTDCSESTEKILQLYFDRWQIEVNHREEKDTLGVGQAQVWSEHSVPRQPAFVVAAYSYLHSAALRVFGTTRTDDFIPLPKWRKNAKRPSLLDLITLIRKHIKEDFDIPQWLQNITANMVEHACA